MQSVLVLLLLPNLWSWELQEWLGGTLERPTWALLHDKLTSGDIGRYGVSRRGDRLR